MKYAVTALTLDVVTGEKKSEPRVEVIDTVSNQLFRGCTGPWQVEDQYHAFWNRLNDSWETDRSEADKVVVLSVVPA